MLFQEGLQKKPPAIFFPYTRYQGGSLRGEGASKVCHEKNYTNSSADNSASRHDSLNLKDSAESGEENE